MPFFVLAGLILITLPVCICILPQLRESPPSEEKTKNATAWKFVKIPAFDIVGR